MIPFVCLQAWICAYEMLLLRMEKKFLHGFPIKSHHNVRHTDDMSYDPPPMWYTFFFELPKRTHFCITSRFLVVHIFVYQRVVQVLETMFATFGCSMRPRNAAAPARRGPSSRVAPPTRSQQSVRPRANSQAWRTRDAMLRLRC